MRDILGSIDFCTTFCYHAGMKQKQEKTFSYFAIYDPAPEGGYNVSFPDFPGCVTFGKTFEEARRMAADVLELWIEELKYQKQAIPSAVQVRRPIVDEVEVANPEGEIQITPDNISL